MNTENSSKPETALILSVGGSPEGQAKSAVYHHPGLVVFFASQETAQNGGEIIRKAKEQGVEFKHRTVTTRDPQSLPLCYESALDAIERVFCENYDKESVFVDFTGGTKTMSAALALATVRHGCRFSYVGGTTRNKDGVGIVESGCEQVFISHNPWLLFAVEYEQQYAFAFNHCQFTVAEHTAKEALKVVRSQDQPLWKARVCLARAYSSWDRFEHARAKRELDETLDTFQNALHGRDLPGILANLIEEIRNHRDFLTRLIKETNNLRVPCRPLVEDLLANAKRRESEGKFDDGVARLYRTLELIGQIALFRELGCLSKEVPLEKIPDSLREEYKRKYRGDEEGYVKIPLDATFRLLEAMKIEEGVNYMKNISKFKGILGPRNASILAHGLTPVKEAHFNNLHSLLLESFGIESALKFPEIISQSWNSR